MLTRPSTPFSGLERRMFCLKLGGGKSSKSFIPLQWVPGRIHVAQLKMEKKTQLAFLDVDVIIALSKQPLNDLFSEDSAQLLSWDGAKGALVHAVLLNTDAVGHVRQLQGRILQLLHSEVCPACESFCQDLSRVALWRGVASLSMGCTQQPCIVISVCIWGPAEHGEHQS